MLQYTALTARSVLTQNEAEEALSKKRQGSGHQHNGVEVGSTRRRSRGTESNAALEDTFSSRID